MAVPARLPLGTLVAAVAILLGTGIAGYVYSHEPARDLLAVELTDAQDGRAGYLAGVVTSVDGGEITLVDASGVERAVTLVEGARLEDLRRLDGPPAPGATVNVGVDDTRFGQFVTGVVTIEAAP